MSAAVETAMFVGEPAWHGLGNLFAAGTVLSSEQAMTAAGLDWQAELQPLFLGDGAAAEMARAVVRNTDKRILGVVGTDFTPLQNFEAFEKFDPLVQSGQLSYEAAGSLKDGSIVWVLATLSDGTVDVQRGDAIKTHALLAHGHDGSMSVKVGFTETRVVCWNTLMAAFNADGKSLLSVKHTSGVKLNLERAFEVLDMQRGKLKANAEKYRFLASKKCDDTNLVRYVREVLKPGSADVDPKKMPVRNVPEIVENFESGRGAELSRGTMWGAYNAVTEHVTHQRGHNQGSRQLSNWFGDGAKLAQRALDVAVAFAETAPDAASLGRACYDNSATAKADFEALLGRPHLSAAE
jgi:phage/plasmid-like protein (TIGR03299 family)